MNVVQPKYYKVHIKIKKPGKEVLTFFYRNKKFLPFTDSSANKKMKNENEKSKNHGVVIT